MALAALVLAALAVVRGRPRVALLVLVFIAATSVSGQLLKELLAHPRPQPAGANLGLGPEAFPSGHATAVMSLALACVLAAPRRARPGGARLWAKRDDCNSGLALGGSKTRKGADTLVSIAGFSQTTRARWPRRPLTPACRAVLVQESWVDWPDLVYNRVGNMQLSRIMGADVRLVESSWWRAVRSRRTRTCSTPTSAASPR